MLRQQPGRRADEIVSADIDWYCWPFEGPLGSIADARTTTRGKAAAYFASEGCGYLPDVRVWKRYIRQFTLQQIWDGPGRDRWVDREEQNLMSQRELHGEPNPSTPRVQR